MDDHGCSFVSLAWLMDKLDPLLGLDENYFDSQVQVLIEYYRQRKDYRKLGEGT